MHDMAHTPSLARLRVGGKDVLSDPDESDCMSGGEGGARSLDVLLDLVLDDRSFLVPALEGVLEHSEIKPVSAAFLSVFEEENATLAHILALIEQSVDVHMHEVKEEEGTGTTLLRKDTITTALMSSYALGHVEKRYNYLEHLLGDLIAEVIDCFEAEQGSVTFETETAQEELLTFAESFKVRIFSSWEKVPPPLRIISNQLWERSSACGFEGVAGQIVGGL